MQRVNRLILMLSLPALFLLTACGGDKHLKEAQQFMNEVEQRPRPPVEPVPELRPQQKIKYSEQNMRNPFTPQQAQVVDTHLSPDMNRPKEDLEQFPLDGLRMVGTLTQDTRVWALILAPDKSVYKATIGSHIGQNYGRIESITKDRVNIVETIPDGLGGWKERDAYLSLAQ